MKKIHISYLKDEDFLNYKKPAMYIGFPYCTFKCGRENCQNVEWENAKIIEIDPEDIAKRYMNNIITSAIVIGGLEPLDSYDELIRLVAVLRKYTKDDIVIYTGYNRDEVESKIDRIGYNSNIIMKFGRYIPGDEPHYDELLGIKLASNNQYAERVKTKLSKYQFVDDKAQVEEVLTALKANGGYCPCKLVKNEDTKCQCKEFRESPSGTTCHCGLYVKK